MSTSLKNKNKNKNKNQNKNQSLLSSRLLSLSLLALVSGSFASGCVLTRDPPKEAPIPRVLYNFDSCDDLLSYAKQHATESLDEYGSLYGQGGWDGVPLEGDPADNESGGDGGQGGEGGGLQPGADYSDTNVQEVGVDEPDLVKTDGDRIVALAGSMLHHIDTKGSPLLTASLDLGETSYGAEMFLYEDRVLLFERVEAYYYGDPGIDEPSEPQPGQPGEGGNQGEGGDPDQGDQGVDPQAELPDQVKAWIEGSWVPITRITEIDISNPDKLEVVAKLYVSGDYLSARRIDGVSRVVLRSSPIGMNFKSPWDFFYSELGWENYPETEEAWNEVWQGFVDKAKAYNAELIDASTLDNWVPHYVFEDVVGGEISEGLLLDCVDTMHAGVYSGLTMTSVLTIDLEQGLSPEGSVGLFADAAIVYASTENLYISTRAWVGGEGWSSPGWEDGGADGGEGGDVPGDGGVDPVTTSAGTSASSSGGSGGMDGEQAPDAPQISFRAGDEEETGLTSYLHKFAIPAGEKAIYTASGEVRGRLLNQWAMNESRGDLRVATTDQQSWDWDSNESFVTVLREEEGELTMVGQVGELGKGEEIKSVRYIGDVGYVVTFRQTDPLYTVDLSDHENPKVAGELKINGYSAYLHPLGEDHMIGVGFDGTDEGQLLGVQVSLFDISDINAPTRTDSVALGDFGWTEVAFDHKAFLYWEPTDLTVFPVESYSWDEEMGTESWFMGAAGYTITPEAGIEPLGTITHMTDPNDPWQDGNPSLRRSLVIGDLLYTVSESGLKASALADLSDQAWIDW